MDEIIKIQEEFEILIEQLEKLKSINEITTSNTESAKLVIIEINDFIKSLNEFKNKVNLDFENKSFSINNLVSCLDLSVVAFETQTNKFINSITVCIDDLKENSKNGILDIKNSNDVNITEIRKLSADIYDKINHEINALKLEINSSIEKMKNEFSDSLSNLSLKIDNNQSTIQAAQETNHKETKKEIETIRTSISKEIANLSLKIDKNHTETKDLISNQYNEINTIKTISYLAIAIVVLILIVVIVKK
ncbi:MAG: hypothetical protein EAZ27_01140 [Cytophagales bacterium]|nr:MAG: hypothetical protein EAZ27_01140 [Cytophagales bacterium]